MRPKAIRYAFVATGNVLRNASFVRLRELGRQFALRGLDVHYFLDDEESNAVHVAPSLDFATIHLAAGAGRGSRLFSRRRQLAAVAPDAVHILNPQPGNCGTAAGLGIPLVCDWDELLSSRDRRFLQRRIDLACEAFGRRCAAVTVVASRALQAFMSQHHRIDALYLPYAAYLTPLTDGPDPFATPTAVYMGNLMPDFDHDLIIDAWELLQQRGNPLKLCILGGGPQLETVRADVHDRRLANVTVAGYITGQPLWDHLRHAHLLLFPIRDTAGNRSRCPSKTFAYMQARRPVLANPVGEVAEALGPLGWYTEPTPHAFADAVDSLAGKRLADVDYPLTRHPWNARASMLLERLAEAEIISV
jgi:glycosyltransferase involved in cell wall biosynthesis